VKDRVYRLHTLTSACQRLVPGEMRRDETRRDETTDSSDPSFGYDRCWEGGVRSGASEIAMMMMMVLSTYHPSN
jgi:hypothetical protein